MIVLNRKSPQNALPALEDKAPTAHIQHVFHSDTGKPFVKILTVNSGNGTRKVSVAALPRYDMSRLPSMDNKYCCPDYDAKIYYACSNTKEGKRIINDIKNAKTVKLVDEYTDMVKNSIDDTEKVKKGHPSILKKFLALIRMAPLADSEDRVENLLPHSALELHREEIWKAFKESGLVRKIKSSEKSAK